MKGTPPDDEEEVNLLTAVAHLVQVLLQAEVVTLPQLVHQAKALER